MHYCYILYSSINSKTYNGYTVNPVKRIRQHNGVIKGGAKYTTRLHSEWTYLIIVELVDVEWTYNDALSFEWHIKYPTNRKPRPKEYNGAIGRLKGLLKASLMDKFKEKEMKLYVADQYFDYMQELVFAHDDKDNTYKNILSIHRLDELTYG